MNDDDEFAPRATDILDYFSQDVVANTVAVELNRLINLVLRPDKNMGRVIMFPIVSESNEILLYGKLSDLLKEHPPERTEMFSLRSAIRMVSTLDIMGLENAEGENDICVILVPEQQLQWVMGDNFEHFSIFNHHIEFIAGIMAMLGVSYDSDESASLPVYNLLMGYISAGTIISLYHPYRNHISTPEELNRFETSVVFLTSNAIWSRISSLSGIPFEDIIHCFQRNDNKSDQRNMLDKIMKRIADIIDTTYEMRIVRNFLEHRFSGGTCFHIYNRTYLDKLFGEENPNTIDGLSKIRQKAVVDYLLEERGLGLFITNRPQ